jgi:hypothetical protein
MKKGDRIRIIRMDDAGGKDWQAARMNGVVATVDYVDSAAQIHLEGYGLAVIPGVDKYEIIGSRRNK